jgi:hypothetical protein
MRAACPTRAVFVRAAGRKGEPRPYRRRMNQFPESAFQDGDKSPGFLSRVAIAFVLLTAGVSLAVLISAA